MERPEPTQKQRNEMRKYGFTWVRPHLRNGHPVRGHWRRVPTWAVVTIKRAA
ncbi:hypothetical protein Desti_3378 [Desulfomonile tiedjei DSM 6799]|uniref:Uncharacterized protein n=1 Tax=Desulfomonile tiedjei (strain ATCC 49306 / DSM 6799 / DCB-1) TaxID=706587 RepID=I4C8Z2_DESTA|nr:hypothetical protein Desti_3378 [Desulfomonile tiedjei DSM 6799]